MSPAPTPEQVQQVIAKLPRAQLLCGQSPARSLDALTAHVRGLNPSTGGVYLKDDGALNPLYGGNKVRKLEWLLGDALSKGAREVWTIGGLGSHHALATALHCAQLGLTCRVAHVQQPVTPQVLATLTALISSESSLHLLHPPTEGERVSASVRAQLTSWLEEGERALGEAPYFIPSGGSSALGAVGYLLAALELGRDIEQGRLPMLKRIYVACGSGSTLAGLALGLSILALPIEVVGVRVVSRALVNERSIGRLIEGTLKLLVREGLALEAWRPELNLRLNTGHIGRGYGHETQRGRFAQALAQRDGLTLDGIYTAKAMSALLEEASQRSGASLFWGSLSSVDLSPAHARAQALGGLSALPCGYHELLNRMRIL